VEDIQTFNHIYDHITSSESFTVEYIHTLMNVRR